MIRKVADLPSDDGLVLPLIVGQASFELVHRPVAHDLRQSREILCGDAPSGPTSRRMVRGSICASVEEIVESRAAYRQARSGRKLIIHSSKRSVHAGREVHVNVEGRVWTVVCESLRLVSVSITAEEM